MVCCFSFPKKDGGFLCLLYVVEGAKKKGKKGKKRKKRVGTKVREREGLSYLRHTSGSEND